MSMKTDKMLAVLLALFLALGSVSSAFAASHSCGSDDGRMTATEHSAHMGTTSAGLDDNASAGQTDFCQDCSADCCVSGACTSNACGSSASAVTSSLEVSLSFSVDIIASDLPDRAVINRQTPPFRPPRA